MRPQQWRVVGGVPAKLHTHPWIAALGYTSGPEGEVEHLCTHVLYTVHITGFRWSICAEAPW